MDRFLLSSNVFKMLFGFFSPSFNLLDFEELFPVLDRLVKEIHFFLKYGPIEKNTCILRVAFQSCTHVLECPGILPLSIFLRTVFRAFVIGNAKQFQKIW